MQILHTLRHDQELERQLIATAMGNCCTQRATSAPNALHKTKTSSHDLDEVTKPYTDLASSPKAGDGTNKMRVTITGDDRRRSEHKRRNSHSEDEFPPIPTAAVKLLNMGSGLGMNMGLSMGMGVGMGMDLGAYRGEQELGCRDYFARNLFVTQYGDDEDEEIVSVRAHTQAKLLKIARDDFVLIMQAAQHMQHNTHCSAVKFKMCAGKTSCWARHHSMGCVVLFECDRYFLFEV